MRLYDRMTQYGINPRRRDREHQEEVHRRSNEFLAAIRKANPVIVDANNVADYYFQGTEKAFDIETDFPSLAPPWPLAFIEYKAPRLILTPEDTRPFSPKWGKTFGVLMIARDARATKDELLDASNKNLLEFFPAGARWFLENHLFVEFEERHVEIMGTLAFFVDQDGAYVRPNSNNTQALFIHPFDHIPSSDTKADGAMCWCFTAPVLLAINFIHCRNVRLIDNHVPPALAKAYLRRHDTRPVSFKTLEIEPIKRILAKEGNASQNGLAKALHICRGHFKDYRQSSGLFGKHKDMYWWPMHLRGSLDEGVAVKDYQMPTPDPK